MARSAYDYCLDLLSARAYTARNLRKKLIEREYPADEIDAAVDRLVANGLLDDRRFAYEFARQKIVVAGASPKHVKRLLVSRGIAGSAADAAISQVTADEPVDQMAAIERIAVKKLRSLSDLDDVTRRRRLFAFLARKGYELDDVKQVIARLLL